MTYICKVLTKDFKSKVDKFLDEEVKDKLDIDDKISSDRYPYLASFERIRQRDYLNSLWNNQYKDLPEVLVYYESVGLITPEFEEIELEPAEVGYQSRSRVLWNNEIQKIDDIDEIFSYKTKTHDS